MKQIFKSLFRIRTVSQLAMTDGIMVMLIENHSHPMLSMDEISIQTAKPKIVSVNWVQMDGMMLCVLEHGLELENTTF